MSLKIRTQSLGKVLWFKASDFNCNTVTINIAAHMNKPSLRSLLTSRVERGPKTQMFEQPCFKKRIIHLGVKWCLPLSHVARVWCNDSQVIPSYPASLSFPFVPISPVAPGLFVSALSSLMKYRSCEGRAMSPSFFPCPLESCTAHCMTLDKQSWTTGQHGTVSWEGPGTLGMQRCSENARSSVGFLFCLSLPFYSVEAQERKCITALWFR